MDNTANHEVVLSDEQIELIAAKAAERAAEKAVEKVFDRIYAEVGRSVISKAMWFCGAGLLALASWLAAAGKIKI